MMIFNLPRDLVEEILSRVPLKSKKAVRLTCKKWNTYLTKMHQRKLAGKANNGESRIIVLHGSLSLMSVVVNENPSTKFLGKLTCQNEPVHISEVFHCEGLFLCLCNVKGDDTKVVVWNPYLGQTRWIETKYPNRGVERWFIGRYNYALGRVDNKKDKSLCSYKILRFLDYYYRHERYSIYEIYDFDSDDDLWKVLDDPSQWMLRDDVEPGVSLEGSCYWCASPPGYKNKSDHIICFDFKREKFGPFIPLPFEGDDNSASLSCVRENGLAVIVEHCKRNPYEIDVWITTKIEAEEITWSKFLTVDIGPPDCPMSLWRIFIEEEKKVVMGFDYSNGDDTYHHTLRIIGEAGYLRKLELEKCEHKNCCYKHLVVCSYIPSLVQIKPLERRGGKRENQSNLEKHRYGEKKLKIIDM